MAKENEKPVVATEAPVEEQSQVVEQISAEDYRGVVNKLIAEGAKQFKGVKIKNVTLTNMGNYIRVGLTVIPNLPRYDENGKETTGNVIFTSLFALIAIIKENEELSWVANTLGAKPQLLNMVLCGSTIDVIQRRYEAGVEIYNPYSKRADAVASVYDHKTIITDVNELHLGKVAVKMLDKIANRMIDSAFEASVE